MTSRSPEDSIFHPDQATFIDIDGLSIRVVRDETGARGTPVLLTSPYPESVAAFHAVWPRLKALGPLVAVDLPGFGRSQGRKDLMSPAAMGAFFPMLLDALGLERVHAVVPDVSTLAALFAASEHPERFESIVAGSGGAALDLLGEPLRQIVESRPGDFAGQDGGQQVVDLIGQTMRVPPPADALEDYRRSSSGQRWNEAADFVRAYARDLPVLAEKLPTINVPVLVISGSGDPFVPPANGEFLSSKLSASVAVVVDAGHFVWEDAPDRYAELVSDWISGGCREAAG